MTDVVCKVRLGAAFTATVPSIWRDEASTFTAEFTNRETAALVDVSGVTARLFYPTGAEAAAPTPAETSAGIWTVEVDPAYQGRWCLIMACTSPNEATASFYFMVKATEPDTGAPPDPTYYEAVALVDRAETAADGAEAAQAAAEAAQAAAESAASSSLGPMTVTSVGGTPDVDGDVLTYTGVLPAAPQLGSEADFTPTAPNAAAPRLRPTVGGVLQSQKSIKDAAGGTLGRNALNVGQNYRLTYDGTNWRVTGEVIAPRVTKATSRSWIYAAPGDEADYGQVRLRYFEGGEFLFDAGDGTAATGWASKWGYYDGAFRVYGARAYVGGNVLGEDARVLTDHRPPQMAANVRNLIGPRPRANSRTSPQRLTFTSADYFQIGGLDTADKRFLVVAQAGSGTWFDAQHMPKGSEALVINLGFAVSHLYTGEGEWSGNGTDAATLTAHSWLNTGGKLLTTSAGAWVRIYREGSTFFAVPLTGSVSAGSASMPSHDLVFGFGPQSWGLDMRKIIGSAMRTRLLALGLGAKVYSPDTANVGASTMLYFAAKAALFHWDQRTDVPGRRLLDIIAAIQADRTARTTLMGSTAPAMTDFGWFLGLNDMGYFGPTSTHPDNNPAKLTASFVKAAQRMDADLGYSLRHWIIPLTSQKLGTFGETLWHAVRMALLRLPAAGLAADPPVQFVIGPEAYGDPRSTDDAAEDDERHYDFEVQESQADRLAQAWANEEDGQTNHEGPDITGVATADAGVGIEWDVTIDYHDGGASEIQAKRPELVLRLLPAATGVVDTDDFATPLTILSTRWVAGTGTTIKLRCTLDAAYLAGTPRVSVVWGSAEATDDISCVILTRDPVTAKRWFLRQHLSGG